MSYSTPVDPGTHHDQALELLGNYERAFNANDARTMNSLFADDCVFVNFGGNLVIGRAALYDAQAVVFDPGGALNSISVSYTPEVVTMLGSKLTAVVARQQTAGATPGEPDPMEAVLTIILESVDGHWWIRMGQNTPVRR